MSELFFHAELIFRCSYHTTKNDNADNNHYPSWCKCSSPPVFFVNSDESHHEDETGRRIHMYVQCGQLWEPASAWPQRSAKRRAEHVHARGENRRQAMARAAVHSSGGARTAAPALARPSTCALTAQSGSSHTSSATACRRAAQLARVGKLALEGWYSNKKNISFFAAKIGAHPFAACIFFNTFYIEAPSSRPQMDQCRT